MRVPKLQEYKSWIYPTRTLPSQSAAFSEWGFGGCSNPVLEVPTGNRFVAWIAPACQLSFPVCFPGHRHADELASRRQARGRSTEQTNCNQNRVKSNKVPKLFLHCQALKLFASPCFPGNAMQDSRLTRSARVLLCPRSYTPA
jgi:hypothetical protein